MSHCFSLSHILVLILLTLNGILISFILSDAYCHETLSNLIFRISSGVLPSLYRGSILMANSYCVNNNLPAPTKNISLSFTSTSLEFYNERFPRHVNAISWCSFPQVWRNSITWESLCWWKSWNAVSYGTYSFIIGKSNLNSQLYIYIYINLTISVDQNLLKLIRILTYEN